MPALNLFVQLGFTLARRRASLLETMRLSSENGKPLYQKGICGPTVSKKRNKKLPLLMAATWKGLQKNGVFEISVHAMTRTMGSHKEFAWQQKPALECQLKNVARLMRRCVFFIAFNAHSLCRVTLFYLAIMYSADTATERVAISDVCAKWM